MFLSYCEEGEGNTPFSKMQVIALSWTVIFNRRIKTKDHHGKKSLLITLL
jgi:hypothetical protein